MQLRKPKPKPTPFVSNSTVIALLLVWLLSGCVTQPKQPPSMPPEPVRLQPLPQSAIQPQLPPECFQTCLANLTSERERWRTLLTGAEPQGSSAKPSTTQQ